VPDSIRDPAAFPQAPERAEAHMVPGFHRGSEVGDDPSAPCFTNTQEIIRSVAKAATGLPRPTGERGRVRGLLARPPTLAVPDLIRDPAAYPQEPARAEAHINPGFHRGSDVGDDASAPCFTDTREI